MMPLTKFLSRLFGLSLILLALALVMRRQATVETLTALAHTPPLLFTLGMVFLIAGLAVVLSHNIWSGGALPIVVTLLGWIILVRGLLLLVLSPEAIVRLFAMIHFEQLFYFYIAVSFVIGAYLTYGGFSSSPKFKVAGKGAQDTKISDYSVSGFDLSVVVRGVARLN